MSPLTREKSPIDDESQSKPSIVKCMISKVKGFVGRGRPAFRLICIFLLLIMTGSIDGSEKPVLELKPANLSKVSLGDFSGRGIDLLHGQTIP